MVARRSGQANELARQSVDSTDVMSPALDVPSDRPICGRVYFGHTLDKTRLCKHFQQGRCFHGSGCVFAHGPSELQSLPDFSRSQLCEEFARHGACRFGDRCRFAHGASQLRSAEYRRALVRGTSDRGGELGEQGEATLPVLPVPEVPLQQDESGAAGAEQSLKEDLAATQRHIDELKADSKMIACYRGGEWSAQAGDNADKRDVTSSPASTVAIPDDGGWVRGQVDDGENSSKGECSGKGAPMCLWDMPSELLSEHTAPKSLVMDLGMIVKNTFLEVADPEEAPALRRVRSSPCLGGVSATTPADLAL